MTNTATAEIPAGSAPATEAAPNPIQANFEAWQKTLRPEDKSSTPPGEGSAPPPETAAAPVGEKPAEESETATESASETEAQEKGEKGKHGKGTPAEQRVKDLLVERKRLESRVRELEEAVKQPPKAESAPPAAKALEAPKKPKLEDFKIYEEYDAAKDKYFEDLSEYKAKLAVEEDRRARAQAEVDKTVAQKIQEAKGRYGDYDDTAVPFAKELTKAVSEQRIHPLVSDAMGRQPHMADIMYVIGKDQKEVSEFLDLAHRDPLGAVMKIAVFEQLIAQELAKPPKESEPPKSESKTPAPPETKASKPPSEVGGRAAAPPDALEAASARRDFRSFEQEATRRYVEKRR